jgi:hypothetical protein
MQIGSDGAIRGEVRLAAHNRLAHGLYRPETPHLDARENLLLDLSALRLVLPEDAVYTHITGADLLGWQLPKLPEQVPRFAAVRGTLHTRRPGLICSRLIHESEPWEVSGLLVDAPEEIVLRAARDLADLDLAIMLDSAARLGHITEESMAPVLTSGRPGVRRLRRVWDGRDERAESAGETLLRKFHDAMDVPTQSQVELFDDEGNFVARADLLVSGTLNLHEYDGAIHRNASVQKRDLRRERALAESPYTRRGYTLDDLLNHDIVVMHELDRLFGRSHQDRRLRVWRSMVGDSLYSPAGRARVMNRWYRSTTPTEWARTA